MKNHTTNYRLAFKLAKQIMIILVLALVMLFPVFGKISSAQSRVLQKPDDIVTTRKANFKAGDFMDTPLVSITIRNDKTKAYLLMVLNFDFGGTWDAEYAEVKMVWEVAPYQVLTFTNKDMISSISNIKAKSYSPTLKTKLGISSLSEMQSDISKLMGIVLPEGTHKVTLKAYEIPTADIPSSLPAVLKEQEVSFNVVTIGSINIIDTPTVDKLSLTFQVPEIPVYAASVQSTVSSTKVKITGLGVDRTLSKTHTASVVGSEKYKGYPGDLKAKDGYVTYDLSKVPFRAGERYQAEITFLDWNNTLITSKTVDLTAFSTPRLYMNASFGSPFSPEFSWGFTGTDYSSWVKEYRLYLNGSYYGYTGADSFAARSPLTPNTTYTWYVMPIHFDGSPFFSSGEGLAKSFTTKAHTGLTIQIDSPRDNATLLINETYDFSSSAIFSDDAELKTASWKVGTETKSGLDTTYKPTKRFASGSLSAIATVTDSLGLSKSSDSLRLTVLDPAIAIVGGTTRTVNKGIQSNFAIDTGVTRDVTSYEWFVDGQNAGNGAQLPYTFDESGTFTVSVSGTTGPDMLGKTKTVNSSTMNVTVVGEGPIVSIVQPTSSVEMIVDSTLNIISDIVYENPVASTTWSVSGPDTSQSGTSGKQLRFTPTRPGEYTISVTAKDIHGKSASATTRVLAINPAIRVASPAVNTIFSLSSTLTPVIDAPNADQITWFIGSSEVTGPSQKLIQLGTGRFDLYATGTWNVVDPQGKPSDFKKSSEKIAFQVKDLEPPAITIEFPRSDTVFKAGTSYRLSAEATSASAIKSSWWEADGVRLPSNTYTPSTLATEKLVRLTYRVTNTDGISGSQSVSVRKITPSVMLVAPTTKNFLLGTTLPISATAVDSTLFWLIDGVERASWDKTFLTAGNHTVQVGWRVDASDSSGSTQQYSGLSEQLPFSIYTTTPPRIVNASPEASLIQAVVNQELKFSINTTSDNPLEETVWSEFRETSQLERVGVNYKGNSFTATYTTPGLYTIKARVADTFGYSSTKEWTVKVIDPQPVITYPEGGMTFSRGSVPAPVVSKQGSTSFRMLVDGRPVESNFDWNTLPLGIHTLVAEGSNTVSGKSGTVTSNPVTFTIENKTPPEFSLDSIQDGDRLISGQVYSIHASPSTAATRLTVDTFKWFLDGTEIFASKDSSGVGERYRFQPHSNPSDPSVKQTITVRGTLGGISEDKSATFSIINPTVKAKLPSELMKSNATFPADTEIPLLYEGTHIDRVEWFVDGYPYQKPTVSFSEPGMHTISLNAYATNVRMPDIDRTDYLVGSTQGMMYSVTAEFDIIGKPTIGSLDIPASLYSNQALQVGVNVTQGTDNLISIAYRVNGKLFKESKAPVETMVEIPALTAGSHLIQVAITDKYGNVSTKEQSVIVYDPLSVFLKQPLNNTYIAPNSPLIGELEVLSGKYNQIFWNIDGKRVPNSNFLSGSLGRLSSGSHIIEVQVKDILNSTTTLQATVEVESDFRLSLLAPARNSEIIAGSTVVCMANIEKVAGSTVNLADAATHIMWYVNGTSTGTNGLSYLFDLKSPGTYTVQARYTKGAMVRTTEEHSITVRGMVSPSILSPLNGSTTVYATEESIPLRASGEPTAAYFWELDGKKIASGPESNFNPNGLAGEHHLKLTSTLHGTIIERLSTFSLIPNTPPNIALTAPSKQYTDTVLSYDVIAFDVEDEGQPIIELFWDGMAMGEEPKLLESVDIGTHTLTAIATDSKGVSSTKRTTIVVEPDTVEIVIRSPQDGTTYYQGHEIPLQASITDTSVSGGSLAWTIQYLDDPSILPESYTGSTTGFRAKTTGEVRIVAHSIGQNERNRGSKSITIDIEAEPTQTELIWPHGAMVNAGTALKPELVKLPVQATSAPVLWDMNGVTIDDITTLKASSIPGPYKLTAQYFHQGRYKSLSVDFTVNGQPSVTIEKPLANSQVVMGMPVVFTALVTDDQPFKGSVLWTDEDGTTLAEGNTFISGDLPVGNRMVKAYVEDQFGAKGEATVPIQVYEPISRLATTVNENRGTYIVVPGNMPLSAKTSFSGGISPQISWELRSGDISLVKQGHEVFFIYTELSKLPKESVTITCTVTDTGLADITQQEVFRQDHIIQLVGDATAILYRPETSAVFYLGDSIPIEVALVGFTRPTFTTTVNGTAQATSWEPIEGVLLYGTRIPATSLQQEGVYDVVVTVSESGLTKELRFVFNVYQPRIGIFVDNPPKQIDLTKETIQIKAVVAGIPEVDSILWYSGTEIEPIAFGPEAVLSSENLTPGNRNIIVEARAGDEIKATTSFVIKAIGEMSMELDPKTELLILQRGAPVSLSAVARDKDSSPITGDSISWESHLDGLLLVSEQLNFSGYPNIARGEHLLTVTATGKDGTTVSQFQRLQINAPEDEDLSSSEEYLEPPEELYVGDDPYGASVDRGTFDQGEPIDPYVDPYMTDPFGPGGSPMDPALEGYMTDYFSDPYGGFGGGYDPYGGFGGGYDPYGGFGGGYDPYGGFGGGYDPYGGFGGSYDPYGGFGGGDPYGGWGF